MGIATPNRIADPVSLERFLPPCKIVQEGGLFIPYYNDTELTLITGEPIIHAGRVCIVQRTILPGKMGTLLADWIVDAAIHFDNAAEIVQNELVYWDTGAASYYANPEDPDTPYDDFGAAITSVAPDNGFILGRASGPHYDSPPLNGSDEMICATATSLRVRVICLPGAPTTYGS